MLRKLIYVLLLIVVFAIGIFAQIVDSKPVFTIDCPPQSVRSGEKIRLTAATKAKIGDSAAYNWTVSAGTIISGQGTPTIELQTPIEAVESLTATVEIGGVYFENIEAECTFQVYKKPIARKTDELTFSAQGELKARLDSFFVELLNDPTTQGYILIYPPTPREQARVEKVIHDFIKFRHYDASRITIIIGEKRDARAVLQLWVVPTGAEFTPDETEKSPSETPLQTVKADANACELNALYLDSLRTELANNPSNSVRINFSPGKTETAVVNLKRQKIFTDKIKNRFPNVETQIGEKTDGSGEVRIYLRNFDGTETFYLLIHAIKNKSICLNCCDSADMPKNLIPTVKRKTVKKKLSK